MHKRRIFAGGVASAAALAAGTFLAVPAMAATTAQSGSTPLTSGSLGSAAGALTGVASNASNSGGPLTAGQQTQTALGETGAVLQAGPSYLMGLASNASVPGLEAAAAESPYLVPGLDVGNSAVPGANQVNAAKDSLLGQANNASESTAGVRSNSAYQSGLGTSSLPDLGAPANLAGVGTVAGDLANAGGLAGSVPGLSQAGSALSGLGG